MVCDDYAVSADRFRDVFRGTAPFILTDFAHTLDWKGPDLWSDQDYLRMLITDTAANTPVSINMNGTPGEINPIPV